MLPLLAAAAPFLGKAALSVGTSAALGGLGKLFGGGKKVEPEDIRSQEQIAAQNALQQLAMTGSGAGINLGQAYGGQLGAYDTSGQQTAYGQLQGLFGGGALGTAQDTLTKLTNLEFNPDDPSSGYAAFQRQLARAGKEASDVLNRESAITGSRYGTAIAGEKADLASRLADQSATQLANLYNQQQNRALSAASGLQSLAGTQADISLAASNQAAMMNQIKDQQAKDALNEFKRQRSEEMARIDLLQTEANRNPYLGVTSLPGSPSPFSSLANSVLGSIGERAGGSISDMIFGKEQSDFDKFLDAYKSTNQTAQE